MTGDFSLVRRRALDAVTRFRRAAAMVRSRADNPANESERWLAGYEAEAMLERVLWEAETLVGALNDDTEAEDALRHARTLYEALKARRLAGKLANVEGRTPEEAETFRAKARALKAG